jgi:hypothetical protein
MIINNKIKYPYKEIATEELKERKAEILDSLPAPENIIRSSLITRYIKCRKLNCHCADGDGHERLYLSSYYRGYTYLDYVPKAYEERISGCLGCYETMSALLTELCEINLELFRRRALDF